MSLKNPFLSFNLRLISVFLHRITSECQKEKKTYESGCDSLWHGETMEPLLPYDYQALLIVTKIIFIYQDIFVLCVTISRIDLTKKTQYDLWGGGMRRYFNCINRFLLPLSAGNTKTNISDYCGSPCHQTCTWMSLNNANRFCVLWDVLE